MCVYIHIYIYMLESAILSLRILTLRIDRSAGRSFLNFCSAVSDRSVPESFVSPLALVHLFIAASLCVSFLICQLVQFS